MAASILIVEDDQPTAMAMARILKQAGYGVATAPDAVLAVSTARRAPPDLVLLDLALPGGGGLAVLERIHGLANAAAVPVSVITGGSDRPEISRAVADGEVLGVLHKPVPAEDLLAAVAVALPPAP